MNIYLIKKTICRFERYEDGYKHTTVIGAYPTKEEAEKAIWAIERPHGYKDNKSLKTDVVREFTDYRYEPWDRHCPYRGKYIEFSIDQVKWYGN